MFQLARAWPRHEAATATSDTMMEGGMQLLNRDGHSISHNSKRHYHDSFVSMNRMRQRGLLCDIVLHVSNKEIKAHKVVLASCSPYFHAMFTSEFTLLLFFSCSLSPVFLFGCFASRVDTSTSVKPPDASFLASCLGRRWSDEMRESRISSRR